MNVITETTIEKTARLLTPAHDIRVVFETGSPGIKDLRTIRLPPVNYAAPAAQQNAMHGYLDNQVAKMLFSDVRQILNNSKDKLLIEIFNVVEHPRVEKQLQQIYPGTEYNFQSIYDFLGDTLSKNWDDTPLVNKILFTTFMEQRYPGHEYIKNAYTLEPDLKTYVDYIKKIIDDDNPQSTAASFATAKKIRELFEDLPPDEETEPSEGPDMTEVAKSVAAMKNIMGMEGMLPEKSISTSQDGTVPNVQQNYTHDISSDNSYIVWSTAGDVYEKPAPLDFVKFGPQLLKFRESVRPQTGVIKGRLVNTLRTLQRSKWTTNKYEGRLDAKKAYRSVLGISDAIYKQKEPKLVLDVAVALAIDHSGSMDGDRLDLASKSAIVLGDVFDQLKIPFLVYGFSTSHNYHTTPTNPEQYARFNNLWIHVYSGFKDNWKKNSINLINARARENTLDGESVRWGCQQLLAQPQKRKILFVFNDGAPYPGYGNVGRCQKFLKKVVEQSTKAGVEIVTFGIQTDDVKHYYPNYVVINNIDDLVKEPLKKIDGMLRKGLYK